MAEEEESTTIPVTLKWSKKTFELTLNRSRSALDFKESIQQLTGVPVHRQKLLATKGGWKGPLSDDYDLSRITSTALLKVTLIGSAEILTGPTTTTTFVEDLTPEQIQAAERAELEEALQTARGMIPAVQLEPHKRQDNKAELYQYNYMVQGLPQGQIEDLLLEQQQSKEGTLLGKAVMTMGLELRRAYINDLAVLPEDGTLVSALDDGHIQLWKHGAQQHDIIHPAGPSEGGVDSVVALNYVNNTQSSSSSLAFASAGRGSIQLWNDEGDAVLGFQATPIPGATSPVDLVCLPLLSTTSSTASAVVVAFAARFRLTPGGVSNPHQFRLPPQNEAERQRRAQAQAQEQARQAAIAQVLQSIQIWYSVGSTTNTTLKSFVLEGSNSDSSSSVVSCLESMPIPSKSSDGNESAASCLLVSGDSSGALRVWRLELDPERETIQSQEQSHVRLSPMNSGGGADGCCSIVCMKALQNGMLAVSTAETERTTNVDNVGTAATLIVARPRVVHILSLDDKNEFRVVATIDGHQDVVQCLCELPNGDLLTGGGKMDATIKLWSSKQLYERDSDDNDTQEHLILVDPVKTLPDAGYVFALQVLLDQKPGSTHFAVAAARYNVVKILL